MKNIILSIALLSTISSAFGQIAPCGLDYGGTSFETDIVLQMRNGTVQQARNAVFNGMDARGNALGCPQEVVSYVTADFTEPTLAAIETVWNTAHKPAIEAIVIDCPRIGRYDNNAALGAYYARLAGYFDDLAILSSVNDMMLAQQYISSNVTTPSVENNGAFGYIHVGSLNPCYPGGVVGSSVDAVCSAIPSLCVSYEFGLFAGEEFLIGDQSVADDFYDGGIAYDHGWNGLCMIEAAIQQDDSILKSKYKTSAVLAANWAINEHSVKNHNYTSKLVWLLAQMYLWSGDDLYKNELNEKLNRNLLPGILMDRDSDNLVDSIATSVNFSSLNAVAQTPGRMWDGHNSLPWYSAMNAWALTEAYCAFRDQGETSRAAELKPYVVAMLDNLAEEIVTNGVIDPAYLGVRDLTYAFLIGVWKVAQYEGETHTSWENALWALWNTGAFDTYGTNTVCVGLYLVIKKDILYEPSFVREDFNSINDYSFKPGLTIYPNPAVNEVTLDFENHKNANYLVEIYNLAGQRVLSQENEFNQKTIDVSGISAGTYTITISVEGTKNVITERLLVN